MKRRLQVDQSGKVEQTSKPTVVVYADGKQRVVLISAQAKQEAFTRLRAGGRESKMAVLLMFSALLAFLLREIGSDVDEILLDDEYTGQRGVIKHQLMIYLERLECRMDPGKLTFGSIGRSSPAHTLAIEVYRGHRKPDRVIGAEELLSLITKKTPGPAKR